MPESSYLLEVDHRLRAAYGIPQVPEADSGWGLFLRILLLGPGVAAANNALQELLIVSPLATPQTMLESSTGILIEHLTGIPRGPQKAGVLRAVADWWQTQFRDNLNPAWDQGMDFYRDSLRKIRGLGPATVDELLMFVARFDVVPLDRGTLRVAIRHGWLDLPLEDQESQDVFVRGLREASLDSREFSQLISRVAEAHCGREPKCDDCPLQPLLPPNGPLNPDSL